MMQTRHYNGWEAAAAAFGGLVPYFAVAVLIAVTAGFVAFLAGRLQDKAAGGSAASRPRGAARSEMVSLSLYCLCFSTFGTVTAYFIAQGLLDESGKVTNSLLANFVAPFIALLTGGVTFAASKSHRSISRSEVALGVACFLLSCVLAYESFKIELTHRKAIGPDAATQNQSPAQENRAQQNSAQETQANGSANTTDDVNFDPNQLETEPSAAPRGPSAIVRHPN